MSVSSDSLPQGNISLEKSARVRPFDWLPEQGWEDIVKLTSVLPDVFGSLADDIERNERSWQEVCMYTCVCHWTVGCVCLCSRCPLVIQYRYVIKPGM